jgi:hypothetical protein
VQAGSRVDASSISLVPPLTCLTGNRRPNRERVCRGITHRFIKKGTTEWPCPISLSKLLTTVRTGEEDMTQPKTHSCRWNRRTVKLLLRSRCS